MVNILNAVLYGVGGLVCTCVALLVVFQEKLVYVPVVPGMSKKYPVTPARFRLPFEDVWLLAADGVRLHSWFIRLNPPCSGPTILFFQENAGNIAHRYGESDGYPSQRGIMKDAQAALDHLHQRTDIDTSRIIIFGRSLGGAVGASLAKNNPDKVAALILENTFTSILDMAGVLLPVLKWFIGGSASKGPKILNFLVRSPWNTIDIIDQINQPMLFLSGSLDEMVPPLHMHCLFGKVKGRPNCYFVEFPTGMHMDTWHVGGDRYWQTIQQFINRELPGHDDDDDEQLPSNGWEKEWGEKANI